MAGKFIILEIPLDQIDIGDRQRPIDDKIVHTLAESIERQGLLQDIGVVKAGNRFALVWGAHRLAAFRRLSRLAIPCKVFPEDTPEPIYRLAELAENLERNDLTAGERKAFVAEKARLLAEIANDTPLGNDYENCNLQKSKALPWIDQLAKDTGTPARTLRQWWTDFTAETERTITPAKALALDKQAFLDWMDEQKRKEQEAQAERERQTEAERERQEAAKRAKREADIEEQIKNLLGAAENEFGLNWIRQVLIRELASRTPGYGQFLIPNSNSSFPPEVLYQMAS